MESNFLTAIVLPLALFIIMLGMGLGLTIKDFQRIVAQPKGVLLGLAAQLILLPLVGFFAGVSVSLIARVSGGRHDFGGLSRWPDL